MHILPLIKDLNLIGALNEAPTTPVHCGTYIVLTQGRWGTRVYVPGDLVTWNAHEYNYRFIGKIQEGDYFVVAGYLGTSTDPFVGKDEQLIRYISGDYDSINSYEIITIEDNSETEVNNPLSMFGIYRFAWTGSNWDGLNFSQMANTLGYDVNRDVMLEVFLHTPIGNKTFTERLEEIDTEIGEIPIIATIIANDDAFNVEYNDTSVIGNILTNDTYDGNPATTDDVIIDEVNVSAELTITEIGDVLVDENTSAGVYEATYRLIDKADDTNISNEATVTVTVITPEIEANDDEFSGGTGITSNANIGNVLANDTFNGNPATTSEVDIEVVDTVPSELTFNVNTGVVGVVAGTPYGTGEYSFDYTIIDKNDSDNTSTATCTVNMTLPVITAENDTFNAGNGIVPTTAGNVLTNDMFNGAPATTTDVTITLVGVLDPNLTFNTSTGEVGILAGTPADTYNFSYTITDKINTSNTSTADVNVTVNMPVIMASNDEFDGGNGVDANANIGNVLANDMFNGGTATTTDVTLELIGVLDPQLTFNTSTGVVGILANTPAGVYNFGYKITDNINTSNTSTATVTVTVTVPEIEANDDEFTIVEGDTSTIGNILSNDTYNSELATPSLVDISITSGDDEIIVNTATGDVAAAPDAPVGTYTVNYRITDKINNTNVSDAIVTATIEEIPTPMLIKAGLPAAASTVAIVARAGDQVDWGFGAGYVTLAAGTHTSPSITAGTTIEVKLMVNNNTTISVYGTGITEIIDWGNRRIPHIRFSAGASNGAVNLTKVPNYIPEYVTSIGYMFQGSNSTTFGIAGWDTSNITAMNYTFNSCIINEDISGWDVSNVTNMDRMFNLASAFNQDLSGWCVSNIPSAPTYFSHGANNWVLPKPVWGTCPSP